MIFKKWFLYVLVIIVLIFGYIFINPSSKTQEIKPSTLIAVGEENPGRIALYKKTSNGFVRKTIDVGANYVWTVRIGDVRNDGKNRIYAGIGNSFYSEPYGCKVVEFDPYNNFKKTVIDEAGDIRCKDLTVGDVKNTGKNDLVLGTHGQGIINFYSYDSGQWKKEKIENNYLAQFDKENNTDHAVPQDKLPFATTVQTAVHVVKVGDADNDGKNELLATVSDPLENTNKDHKLFVRMYKWNGSSWIASNIDTIDSVINFKASVDITNLEKNGKNTVVVSASPHQLITYRYENGSFKKEPIDTDEKALYSNMKGLAIDYYTSKDIKSIVIGGGIPQSGLLLYDKTNGKYEKKELINLSTYLDKTRLFKGIADNTLDAKIVDLDGNGKKQIVMTGEQDTGFAGDVQNVPKFGWEATTLGFTAVVSKASDGSYKPEFLNYSAAIALDTGVIPF